MSVKLDVGAARRTLLQAAQLANDGGSSARWLQHIEHLSNLSKVGPKTHIAFIGTALLARSTDPRADPFALHVRAGTPGAYSARTLAKDVLVPTCRELRVHLGVTGREPLNNQPYFHNDVVSREMNVHGRARLALEHVCNLLEELAQLSRRDELLAALAAFVKVRQAYWSTAADYFSPDTSLAFGDLLQRIETFVAANSEGGKRAQAVAAGLMDVVEGEENVETARINDPDRNFPGDVAAYARSGATAKRTVVRVLEVRDKPITDSDLRDFASKALRAGVARAGILVVAAAQPVLPLADAQEEATLSGVNLELFVGWTVFVRQLFFWLRGDAADPVNDAHQFIYKRLIQLECSAEAQKDWLG